jgi:hypothetical protein
VQTRSIGKGEIVQASPSANTTRKVSIPQIISFILLEIIILFNVNKNLHHMESNEPEEPEHGNQDEGS